MSRTLWGWSWTVAFGGDAVLRLFVVACPQNLLKFSRYESQCNEIVPNLDFSPRIWKGGAKQAAEKLPQRITTPALGAPPLLNQEGSWSKNSPPQMRRGGAPSAAEG